jgi:transposase InsO family protein
LRRYRHPSLESFSMPSGFPYSLTTPSSLACAREVRVPQAYVYGPPVSLLPNNRPQFTAKFFQAVCSELGIRKICTTAYHPHTNGQVERYNRTILASLRGYVSVTNPPRQSLYASQRMQIVVLEPACAAEEGETVEQSKGNKINTRTVTIVAH